MGLGIAYRPKERQPFSKTSHSDNGMNYEEQLPTAKVLQPKKHGKPRTRDQREMQP